MYSMTISILQNFPTLTSKHQYSLYQTPTSFKYHHVILSCGFQASEKWVRRPVWKERTILETSKPSHVGTTLHSSDLVCWCLWASLGMIHKQGCTESSLGNWLITQCLSWPLVSKWPRHLPPKKKKKQPHHTTDTMQDQDQGQKDLTSLMDVYSAVLGVYKKKHTIHYTTHLILWIKSEKAKCIYSFRWFQSAFSTRFLHSNSHYISQEWVHFHEHKLPIS